MANLARIITNYALRYNVELKTFTYILTVKNTPPTWILSCVITTKKGKASYFHGILILLH